MVVDGGSGAFSGERLGWWLPRLDRAAGVSLRELMARMGHTSTQTALVYLHDTDDGQRIITAAVRGAGPTLGSDRLLRREEGPGLGPGPPWMAGDPPAGLGAGDRDVGRAEAREGERVGEAVKHQGPRPDLGCPVRVRADLWRAEWAYRLGRHRQLAVLRGGHRGLTALREGRGVGLDRVVRVGAGVEAVDGRRVAGGQEHVCVRVPDAPERERATVDREVGIDRALGTGRARREVRATRGISGVEAAGVGPEGPR